MSTSLRQRLEAQGFCGLDDAALREIGPWLRCSPALYGFVRHPIMLGFLIAVWATPQLSVGHLLYSIATTGYILVGILLEERDLLRFIGTEYQTYREKVPMLITTGTRRR